jgi:nitrate reductase gamma subunit
MSIFFGFVTALADAVAEPARVAAATSESRAGLYVAGLAGAAAIAAVGLILLRRGRGKG